MNQINIKNKNGNSKYDGDAVLLFYKRKNNSDKPLLSFTIQIKK